MRRDIDSLIAVLYFCCIIVVIGSSQELYTNILILTLQRGVSEDMYHPPSQKRLFRILKNVNRLSILLEKGNFDFYFYHVMFQLKVFLRLLFTLSLASFDLQYRNPREWFLTMSSSIIQCNFYKMFFLKNII